MDEVFHAGDKVRDKRFDVLIYGEVIYVDNMKKSLVIKTQKGNFSVPFYMMEHV